MCVFSAHNLIVIVFPPAHLLNCPFGKEVNPHEPRLWNSFSLIYLKHYRENETSVICCLCLSLSPCLFFSQTAFLGFVCSATFFDPFVSFFWSVKLLGIIIIENMFDENVCQSKERMLDSEMAIGTTQLQVGKLGGGGKRKRSLTNA